jgi:Mg2+-importing ATPase
VFLNFFMEFQARHAVEEIRKQVATTAAVVRDGHEQELPVAELVPGDIARLNAGDLVPADARLLEAKDLHVREAVSLASLCRSTKQQLISQRGNTK